MKQLITMILCLVLLLSGCAEVMQNVKENLDWDLLMEIAEGFVADGKVQVDLALISEIVGHDVEEPVAEWHTAAMLAAKAAQMILSNVLSRDPVVVELVAEYRRQT
jgi:hypothetical protein